MKNNAKLNALLVKCLRIYKAQCFWVGVTVIAKDIGVNQATVCSAINGNTWKGVRLYDNDYAFGISVGKLTLYEDAVYCLRVLNSWCVNPTPEELAKEFKVSHRTMKSAIAGETWMGVKMYRRPPMTR